MRSKWIRHSLPSDCSPSLTLKTHTVSIIDPERCGVIKYTSLTHTVSYIQQHKMSKQVLISMLAQGNTGNDILSILDVIVSEQSSEGAYNEPTADMIEF